ncbi:hypothetical protein Tco_1227013 [Tanacetum coccineum]
MNFLSASLTERITEQVKNQLPQILPEEAAAALIEFELKKILIDKIDKSESYLAAPEHRECYEGLIKSYDLDKTLFSTYDKVYSFKRIQKDKDEDPFAGSDRGLKKRKTSKDAESTKEEPEFEVADSDMPQDQKENPSNDDEEPKGKTLQQGPTQSWLMTLASSADKPSKQRLHNMIFQALKARFQTFGVPLKSPMINMHFGVFLIGEINVEVMRKHGYRYLKEIVVRRTDNDLYTFKEGDFPRLRIDDIEDMLLLVVQNRLTNLSGDEVSDFAIALRMFTRSLVIQKLMRSDELYKFSKLDINWALNFAG